MYVEVNWFCEHLYWYQGEVIGETQKKTEIWVVLYLVVAVSETIGTLSI